MPTTVSMPQLGETVTEGTILRWAKQVGDTVAIVRSRPLSRRKRWVVVRVVERSKEVAS